MSDTRRDRTTTSLRLSLRTRLRRWSAVALAVLSLVAAALVANPAPASAAVYGTAMVQTQRMTGPALPPHNTQAGWYSRGQRLTLVCHARGQSVRGYYSPYLPNGGWDNLWYKVSDGHWVADVDINTGSNDPVVGACSSSSGLRLPFASGYSARITQGPGGSYSHTDAYNRHAVDFGVASGTRIVASGSGRIYFEGWATGGAGIQVLIDHGNNRCTQYAHLSRTVIDRGQSVTRGQTIGYSGATGAASGAHLHWNMVNCSTQTSREVVNTLERGTSYPAGTTVTSRNG